MVAAKERPGSPEDLRSGPLRGVRVLEASQTRAGRVAGMLLADLGADVVRAPLPTAEHRGSTHVDPAGPSPETLWWDRGKRVVPMPQADVARHAASADVIVVDHVPGVLRELGWDAASLTARHPALCHVWLPPYGEQGAWAEVAEDPLLLAGLGAVAGRNPATWECPVAPVTATTTHMHGALGAAAAVAALVGRARGDGRGHAVTVSGLHAAGAQVGMLTQEGADQPVVRPPRTTRGVPYWRNYQTSDGRWLYLAALVPEIFFRALDAMDRMDVLVLPGVDGDWNKIQVYEVGGRLVAEALEEEFRTRTLREWLDLFAAADVPCAPIATRAEWAGRDITAANETFVRREHPRLGTVTMPGFPVGLTRRPARAGEFAVAEESLPDSELWPGPAPVPAAAGRAGEARGLPLAGLSVVDLSSYLAGPFIGEILADWGADVVKIEPPSGDPFRVFPMSVLVANQHKRALALDLARDGDAGASVLLRLLRGADLFVENLRPGRLEKLGLTDAMLVDARPDLVRCSVSAYGHAGEYANAPGFDPVFQALSGLADAQGGDGNPVLTAIPLNDTVTGALGALTALAALYARHRDGAGDHLHLSLANSATYLQSPEFTDYAGRPPATRGGTDFLGPSAGHRYYQCSDGWLGVAAVDGGQLPALFDAVEADPAAEGDPAEALAAAFARLTVEAAAGALAARGVAAVPAVLADGHVTEPHLVANGFTHVVADPRYGRFHIIAGYGRWDGETPGVVGTGRLAARALLVGHDSRAVLADAGFTAEEIDALVAAKVVADADTRDVPGDARYGEPAPAVSRGLRA